MLWKLWQPWYDKIVKQLKLDQKMDETAAEVLNDLLPEPKLAELAGFISDHECIVLGAGPSLDEDLLKLQRVSFLNKTLIAADGATSAVMRYRNPTIIVTDLDGNVDDQLEAWRRGSWLVIHGHGDNLTKVREIVAKLKERIIGTTQVKPSDKLRNFGGFTDGDRAAFMAHELGASRIYLAGMDLGTEIGRHSGDKDVERKLVKLTICKDLLAWLAGELGARLINLTSKGDDIPNVPREAL